MKHSRIRVITDSEGVNMRGRAAVAVLTVLLSVVVVVALGMRLGGAW